MRNPRKKIPLETKKEILEQYGHPGGDVDFIQREYAKAVGGFLIAFSNLENSLDYLIITMVNDRTDEPGYRIVKYLNFRNKTKLAKEEYWQVINFINNEKLKKRNKERFEVIFSKLQELGEFRNKVVHANWMSVTEDGYVRVKIDEDSKQGGVQFLNAKITPNVIYKFTRQAQAVASRIDLFQEEVWQDLHRN